MSENRKLPKGWIWTQLQSVARVFSGGAAPQNRRVFAPDGVPFFRVSDLSVKGRTRCLTAAKDRISLEFISKLRLTKAKKNSVVFPKSGAAIATNNRGILGVDGYIVSHLMALEANSKTIPLWLYWAFCQIDMMQYSGNESYPAIRQSTVKEIEIPLPPLAEQERIAELLARQTAAVEKARKAAEEKLAAARLLPFALLRTVFACAQNKTLPENWQWAKLGEVAVYINGMAFKPRDWEKTGLPIIRIQNLNNEKVDFNFFSGQVAEKYIVRPGDLLVAWSASLGVYLWKNSRAVLNQHIFKVVENPAKVEKDFLFFALQNVMQEIETRAHGATMQHIRRGAFESIMIPLPPLAEQKRIADLLDRQTAAAAKAVHAAEDELREIRALPAALLRQAFAGSL